MEQQEQIDIELSHEKLLKVTGGDNNTGAIVGSTVGGAVLVSAALVMTGGRMNKRMANRHLATHDKLDSLDNQLGRVNDKLRHVNGYLEGIEMNTLPNNPRSRSVSRT